MTSYIFGPAKLFNKYTRLLDFLSANSLIFLKVIIFLSKKQCSHSLICLHTYCTGCVPLPLSPVHSVLLPGPHYGSWLAGGTRTLLASSLIIFWLLIVIVHSSFPSFVLVQDSSVKGSFSLPLSPRAWSGFSLYDFVRSWPWYVNMCLEMILLWFSAMYIKLNWTELKDRFVTSVRSFIIFCIHDRFVDLWSTVSQLANQVTTRLTEEGDQQWNWKILLPHPHYFTPRTPSSPPCLYTASAQKESSRVGLSRS